jgi:aminopeptidase
MYSTDKRWKQLGELLVNYSAGVKRGERVMIAMVELEAFPLVHAVYEEVVKAGGLPQVQFLSETLRHAILKFGDDAQLDWVPEIEANGMEWADVYFGLRGAHNLYEQADITADRLSRNQTTMGKISTLRWEKTRWCLVRIPDMDFAQQAQTDLETVTDMFFNACLIDWRSEARTWRRWGEKLDRASKIRIVGDGTDLSFSVDGRRWLVAEGKTNMPDGELATAPVVETVNGDIFFEHPGVLGGRLLNDIRFRWKDGRLVEASSSTNEDYLKAVIGTDAGASLIGEFAMGTNPGVDRFCNDILIDEKIGGTIHIALGRAYPECGGTNRSALHWDIIKDIRRDGAVYVDGKPVLENGVFLM